MATIKVKDCNDCIMCVEYPCIWVCLHPNSNKDRQILPEYDDYGYYKLIQPDWCPLRKESITIKLEQ